MRKLPVILLFAVFILNSCEMMKQRRYEKPQKEPEEVEIVTSNSVIIPAGGGSPIAGETALESPDTTVVFSDMDQEYEVKKGQEVNIVYEGINPDDTFIIYESTWDGYILRMAYRNEPLDIGFKRLCQIYIVASPTLTTIDVPSDLRYEQIIWTPRRDGTWEVRIGTTERGCRSSALNELDDLRSKEYENNVPRK